jgi:hypothetical protein
MIVRNWMQPTPSWSAATRCSPRPSACSPRTTCTACRWWMAAACAASSPAPTACAPPFRAAHAEHRRIQLLLHAHQGQGHDGAQPGHRGRQRHHGARLQRGQELGIGQFPVMEQGQVVGIISANEIFSLAAHFLGAWEKRSGVTLAPLEIKPGMIGRITDIVEARARKCRPSIRSANRRTSIRRNTTARKSSSASIPKTPGSWSRRSRTRAFRSSSRSRRCIRVTRSTNFQSKEHPEWT